MLARKKHYLGFLARSRIHPFRAILTSTAARNAPLGVTPSTELKAAEEAQDVTAMDQLLKVVSKSPSGSALASHRIDNV